MSIYAFHVHEEKTSMQSLNIFGGEYSIVLSTWNVEYALALQSIKTIVSLCETVNEYLSFSRSKIHFHMSGPLTVKKSFLFVRFIPSMELLSKG